MTHWAYYNEFDPYAAWWLRRLIARGLIAPGFVDERSIEDVLPNDLIGFTQVHFFAGIGVWSHALRRAGWSDDRAIWTASCPCQPFSAAGQGNGFADERHVWPSVFHLASVRRPRRLVGEQVASPDGAIWLDLVQTDMEALGYAFGACAFPSAGVGAPHIRDRTYWVADANSQQCDGKPVGQFHVNGPSTGRQQSNGQLEPHSENMRLADTDSNGRTAHAQPQFQHAEHHIESRGGVERLADSEGNRRERAGGLDQPTRWDGAAHMQSTDGERPGPTNGIWRDADWLHGRDGKWRPVEPGSFPLADGSAGRVGRVRADQGHRAGRIKGYGNALNAEAATTFIKSTM